MRTLPKTAMLAHRASLIDVLRAAGAHDWTPEMIEAHKQAELAKAPPPGILWPVFHQLQDFNLWLILEVFPFILMRGALLTGITAGATLILWVASYINPGAGPAFTIAWILAAASFGCTVASGCAIFLLMWIGDSIKVRPPAEWKSFSWKKYAGAIPVEAWRLRQIGKEYPESSIRIHALMQDRKILDPILEIDGHFVLVWDEHGETVLPPA